MVPAGAVSMFLLVSASSIGHFFWVPVNILSFCQANCTLRIRSSDGESTWCLRFILAWELLRERHGEIVRSTPHNSESVWDDQIICVDKDQMWQVWNWGAPGAVGFTFTLRAFTFLDQLPKALKLNYHTLSHSAVGILADERQDWVICQRASQKIEIC